MNSERLVTKYVYGPAKNIIMFLQNNSSKTTFPEVLMKIGNQFHYGTSDMFWAVEIQTYCHCNRECNYCPVSEYPTKGIMSLNLYKKIINELKKIKFVGRVTPSLYGEPLLDHRIEEIVRYTKEQLPNTYICLLTNGDYITYSLFSRMLKNGADDFLITLHDNHYPKHIRKLLSLTNNSQKRKIHIRLGKDLTLMNRCGLVKIPHPKKVVTCKRKKIMTINYKGDVIPCCNDYFGKVVFGNLNTKNLKTIWNGDTFKKFRIGSYRPSICNKCYYNEEYN